MKHGQLDPPVWIGINAACDRNGGAIKGEETRTTWTPRLSCVITDGWIWCSSMGITRARVFGTTPSLHMPSLPRAVHIVWFDANPRRKYRGSRQFLEEDMPQLALATTDDFIGDVALWTEQLELDLRGAAAKA
jgi:hypothetical protein